LKNSLLYLFVKTYNIITSHGKNDFVEISKNLAVNTDLGLDPDLKTILLKIIIKTIM